jgi:hypothetical protein
MAAAYLSVGEKQQKGGSFSQPVAFIPQRRERGFVAPHISDSWPTAGRSGGNAVWRRLPYPGSYSRAGTVSLMSTRSTVQSGQAQFINQRFFYLPN